MQEVSVRPREWPQRMGVINHRDRPGILEGSRLRQCMFSVWYVNNNQHLSSPVFNTPTQTSFLLFYKKPGSYGGDASAWQLKHMDLTACAGTPGASSPERRVVHGCQHASDGLWDAHTRLPCHRYRAVSLQSSSHPESLLQPTNLLTLHKICCNFPVILGNTLKTGSLFW